MKKFITIILLFGATSVLAHESKSKLECTDGDTVAVLAGARHHTKNSEGHWESREGDSGGWAGTLLKKIIANVYKRGSLQRKNVQMRVVRYHNDNYDNSDDYFYLIEEDNLICL